MLHWLRRGASVLILLAVLDYFVLPQVAGTEAALRLLRTVNPWGAAAAIALEIASLVSYSLLTRYLSMRLQRWWAAREPAGRRLPARQHRRDNTDR